MNFTKGCDYTIGVTSIGVTVLLESLYYWGDCIIGVTVLNVIKCDNCTKGCDYTIGATSIGVTVLSG